MTPRRGIRRAMRAGFQAKSAESGLAAIGWATWSFVPHFVPHPERSRRRSLARTHIPAADEGKCIRAFQEAADVVIRPPAAPGHRRRATAAGPGSARAQEIYGGRTAAETERRSRSLTSTGHAGRWPGLSLSATSVGGIPPGGRVAARATLAWRTSPGASITPGRSRSRGRRRGERRPASPRGDPTSARPAGPDRRRGGRSGGLARSRSRRRAGRRRG